MDDDTSSTRSGSEAGSTLSQNSEPFTQEQIDALRGFLANAADLTTLQKQLKEARQNIKKHKEVLMQLMKDRNKSKLKVGDAKLLLRTKTVTKKPNPKRVMEILEDTLKSDEATSGNYQRIGERLHKSLQDDETLAEKEDLVLDKPKKARKKASD